MACYEYMRRRQTELQRQREIEDAIEELGRLLGAGSVTVRVDAVTGAILFEDWERGKEAVINDACAFQMLDAKGSWELQQATAMAETLAGRTVDREVVKVGTHSHDGGKTWGTH